MDKERNNMGGRAGRPSPAVMPREAAALKYTPFEDDAPQVTALGKGYLAEKIIETARSAGVPVYQDEALAKTLNKLRVGDSIPRELYEVVAEVLAFVFDVDRTHGKV